MRMGLCRAGPSWVEYDNDNRNRITGFNRTGAHTRYTYDAKQAEASSTQRSLGYG